MYLTCAEQDEIAKSPNGETFLKRIKANVSEATLREAFEDDLTNRAIAKISNRLHKDLNPYHVLVRNIDVTEDGNRVMHVEVTIDRDKTMEQTFVGINKTYAAALNFFKPKIELFNEVGGMAGLEAELRNGVNDLPPVLNSVSYKSMLMDNPDKTLKLLDEVRAALDEDPTPREIFEIMTFRFALGTNKIIESPESLIAFMERYASLAQLAKLLKLEIRV